MDDTQAILLSDHQKINHLIKWNLELRWGTTLEIFSSLTEFKNAILSEKKYNFIISMSDLQNQNISKAITHICQQYQPDTSLIILGNTEILNSTLEKIISIKNYYGIEELFSTIELNFNLSKKYQNDLYIPIPLSMLNELTIATANIYFLDSSSNKYIKIITKGEPLTKKITHLFKLNIQNLFIDSNDYVNELKIITDKIIKKITKQGSNDLVNDQNFAEKIELLETSGQLFVGLFNDKSKIHLLSKETIDTITESAIATNKLIQNITNDLPPELNKLILLYKKAKIGHLQFHTLLTQHLCIEMVRSESWFTSQIFTTISLMTFFQDILLTAIYIRYPDAPICKKKLFEFPKLTEREKNLVKFHPRETANYLLHFQHLAPMLDQLILQHHGNLNGTFDDSEPQDEVMHLAKVIYIADIVAEKIMQTNEFITTSVKLKILQETKSEISKKSYQKLLVPLYNLIF